ncbi:MAG: PspC domain-containing protein [Bacteroidales bacterium]|nr:PspC domain-containing protein [Bacteroidales bacterium]
MKKTIRIHISGYIFNIDEDAYQVLENWLDSVSKQYENENDGDEIFKDIEMRVAELFYDKIGSEGVISITEVSNIIKIMGQPEEFEDNEQTTKTENTSFKKTEKKKTKQKRLYRSEEDHVIAGVCSGLGGYFGIDPVLVRLAFIIAIIIGGFGTILYIILWIIIPKAETVSQKLEMKGEPVNISNIEKAIREEFEFVKEKFNRKKRKKH